MLAHRRAAFLLTDGRNSRKLSLSRPARSRFERRSFGASRPLTRYWNRCHRGLRVLTFAVLFGDANSCMEFGIFSQHHRPGRAVADAYDDDELELVAADRLGYREAWISEHAFPAELLICK